MSGAEKADLSQSQEQAQEMPPPYMPAPAPPPSKQLEDQAPSSWISADVDKTDLSYAGVVSPSELATLRSEFGHVIICPGQVGPFGRTVDRQNRVRIPGALTGVHDTRRKLQGWANKAASEERQVWWEGKIQEKGIKPIKIADILNGVDAEQWSQYRRWYKDVTVSTANARFKARRRRQAVAEQAQLANESQDVKPQVNAVEAPQPTPQASSSSSSSSVAKELAGRGKRRKTSNE